MSNFDSIGLERGCVSVDDVLLLINTKGLSFFETVGVIMEANSWIDQREDAIEEFERTSFSVKYQGRDGFVVRGRSFGYFCKLYEALLAVEFRGVTTTEMDLAQNFYADLKRKFKEHDTNEFDTDLWFKITFDYGENIFTIKTKARDFNMGIQVGF